ncbi:NAD-dependent epimerase/dehydratase family protein [Burkholderia plantarii]|uniref:NAD-dependent epimerase/dehydratase family protein n=1 Tax=Burkholderia plantarii TaxID=41899 RepID=UPI0018DE93F8|nr:NAD-dependent epimerase/dehydratase family protein [Burkholderia plantarii]MBI0331698.1 NAD-dependent epimerase/dehydratase family protein [Burkholderia plantarii]
MKIFITGAGGFIGGSIAAGLVADGHRVVGLVRREEQAAELRAIGVEPRVGSLDDRALLVREAQAADAVINAADSDHRGAVEALIEGLRDSGKVLLHTSGSSIVGDASGGEAGEQVYHEDALPEPTADKAPRVAIDRLVLAAAQAGIRPAVLCNTLIYGHGRGLPRESVQLPRLVRQAQKSGVVRHVGPGRNIWSNVHIDDVVEVYRLALERTPAEGTFYFIENGEAAFRDMSAAIATAMGLGAAEDWPLAEAEAEWGYEMANYGLGSNSRVRGERARRLLGWQPKHASVIDWIAGEMVRGA